ncbi:uncharacterized protein THITE_2123204 [Thermothielavioides terrestris NRRL 8126]|uniref:Uncharacterized protein n=1 Tax=Thermothielavioides terrestris (strain ATCC 38088 / NRRL 8126) TaxID=578455 RepID=G2RGZ8_THETT|nr:uncharacterized protein THITE_2123204 [Thermothielavioides terrestris NRRL 8126]AEO71127.1 hypothetical protein THITE_2123204 [Thermothielavioides terrestris NRRL 8126]
MTPTGKALVEGYRKDILSSFEKDKQLYNPSNENRPQSSALVDLKDPIQVHLLTETALTDSKTFEILSPEEVDDLKKQVQFLSMRVEQARANLAIQVKYRDAAISMARLYSSSKADGKRKSLLGNRMSDSAKEAEMEKQACERRCEELAMELFSLEKRLMEPQRRLLQHTAGILQMTHRASSKKSGQMPVAPMMNGIPGSPESLYTYTNTRNSMDIPSDDLDFDKNLYLPLDQVDGPTTRPRKNTIEIPLKSPIREQNAQLRELREELEKAREENEQLKTAEQQLRDEVARLQSRHQELMDEHAKAAEENMRIKAETDRFRDADSRLRAIEQHMNTETEALRAQSEGQLRTISDTEAKLEALNRKLRDVVVAFNPAKNGGFEAPDAAAGSGETLPSQLEYLETGLAAAAEGQKLYAAEASALDQATARVKAVAGQVQALLQQSDPGQPPAPEGDLDEQLNYLEGALETVSLELARALEAASSASTKKQSDDQVDAVLMGLWEIIQTGHAEIEQQRAARRQARALGQGGDEEDDLSSNEFEGYTTEPYSLQAFSAKVQWLYAQATNLREQKAILQRQIKQQRELNNRSESEKDRELQAKTEELLQTQALLDDAERAANEAQAQLQQVLSDMDTLQKTTAANEAASASTTKAAQEQLKERAARITTLESDVREAESRLAAAEAALATTQSELEQSAAARAAAEAEQAALQSQLSAATAAAESASAQVTQLQQDLRSKDEELDRMNTMVVELKTEVAIAKAELDGAYGTRRQRAAEAAALTNSSQSEELNAQIARLRAELENALRDLEEITAESIAAERERFEMEGRLDEAVGLKAELEAEVQTLRDRLARVQEELDAERLKAPVPVSPAPGGANGAGAGRVGAGASMLSEQFRGVMKEERRKFQEELKEEQAKRRKVEEELRALKRSQAAGASTARAALSPR